MTGFAQELALKQRHKRTRKASITVVLDVVQDCTFREAGTLHSALGMSQRSEDLSKPRHALFF